MRCAGRRVGYRASHVAFDVALVCGPSRVFRVCRRVPRRVPSGARVRVFYALPCVFSFSINLSLYNLLRF